MRNATTIWEYGCDRCKKKVDSVRELKSLFRVRDDELFSSYCNHIGISDLCLDCWKELLQWLNVEKE